MTRRSSLLVSCKRSFLRSVLDSRALLAFYVRTPGYIYFKRGLVFRMLWPELAGDRGNMTIATELPFGSIKVSGTGKQVFGRTRWFVVIREGHDFCTCL